MAGINQVGNSLTGLTGTGTFVGATSPTLVTPRIGTIADTTGASGIVISPAGTAVNYLQGLNGNAGSPVEWNANGSDTDIGFIHRTKGAGIHQFVSAAANISFIIFNGTSNQHQTNFSFANTAATRTVTWPDADGTLLMTGQAINTVPSINFGGSTLANYVEGTFTPTLVSAGGGGVTYDNNNGYYTRIGNRVLFNINILLTGTTLAAGAVTVAGLPIPAATSAGIGQIAYSVSCSALAVTDITDFQAITQNAAPSSIQLYFYAAGVRTALDGLDIQATTQILISGQYNC